MKPTTLLCLALLSLPLGAEPEKLSALDAQLLLEKITELREGSSERIGARYKTAHSAFRSAIQSDAATHDLYLKCIEKVQFEDEKKKASEFRDWKRRHKERTDSPEFRRALRHQLNWLLLTIQAASDDKKREESWKTALDHIDTIFKDAKDLEGSQHILRQNVLSTVFAEAYNIEGIKMEDWPTAPLQLDLVYDGLILPALRSRTTIGQLKQAWEKRILHEGTSLEVWSKPKKGLANNEPSAAMTKFLKERRPQLQWMMEMDLFFVGDQKAASLRMLKHIEAHEAHKRCPDWISEFQAAVKAEIAPPPSEGASTEKGGSSPDPAPEAP